MLTLKLALRNILGAGLRTWLNVIALSFSFVAIIFLQGFYNGMNNQMESATINAQYGGGQYWHPEYDRYDPFTLEKSHGRIPETLKMLIEAGQATPILIRQATLYSEGRIFNILLKGIDPDQEILTIPSQSLKVQQEEFPALIGSRMASSTGLNIGDYVTIRWRDVNSTFDAREVKIAEIMKTDVPEIDNSQIWMPLEKMGEMTGMTGEATIIVLSQGSGFRQVLNDWQYKDIDFLMSDLKALVMSKSIGGSIFYLLLLFLAMLAIFDTQILSIFRRKKEMGTLMALGMTRARLIRLFTIEGAMHAVLAAVTGTIYGLPLLIISANIGYGLPEVTDSYGFAMGNRIFPVYSAALVGGTILLVLVVTTIVSFLPTRKIARLKPTDALRGKLT